MTNFEKIKSMSVTEMAEIGMKICNLSGCYSCVFEKSCPFDVDDAARENNVELWKTWLESEVKDNG